jgi:hypothetical protein
MKQPKKNKKLEKKFKKAGPGERKMIMEDPLYGRSSGSGTIRKSEGFNFTKYLPERLKKRVQNLRNMKKGGSLGQYD